MVTAGKEERVAQAAAHADHPEEDAAPEAGRTAADLAHSVYAGVANGVAMPMHSAQGDGHDSDGRAYTEVGVSVMVAKEGWVRPIDGTAAVWIQWIAAVVVVVSCGSYGAASDCLH